MKHDRATRVPRNVYEDELQRLQAELVKMKEWVHASGELPRPEAASAVLRELLRTRTEMKGPAR